MSKMAAIWHKLFGKIDGDPDDVIAEVHEARAAKKAAEEANREASSRVEAAVSRLLSEYRELRADAVSRTMDQHPPAAY